MARRDVRDVCLRDLDDGRWRFRRLGLLRLGAGREQRYQQRERGSKDDSVAHRKLHSIHRISHAARATAPASCSASTGASSAFCCGVSNLIRLGRSSSENTIATTTPPTLTAASPL